MRDVIMVSSINSSIYFIDEIFTSIHNYEVL